MTISNITKATPTRRLISEDHKARSRVCPSAIQTSLVSYFLQVVLIWKMAAWAILELSSRLTRHGAGFTEHSLDEGERRLACGFVAGKPEES